MARLDIRIIYDALQKRHVVIFRRADGSFGFEAQHYSEEPLENCWIPFGHYSESICDSADRAEHEARGRVDWLVSRIGGD